MDSFVLKQNDTLPALEASLTDDAGPVNLTSATVEFAMNAVAPVAANSGDAACGCTGHAPGARVLRRAAVIADVAGGKVRYDWQAADTAAAGRFLGEFKITLDGRTWSFPTSGFIPITILPDLPS